jgi:hypothetical protein
MYFSKQLIRLAIITLLHKPNNYGIGRLNKFIGCRSDCIYMAFPTLNLVRFSDYDTLLLLMTKVGDHGGKS